MPNNNAVAVETQIDLPDKRTPVSVSLESDGVSFVAFRMDLLLNDSVIKAVEDSGTENDLGKRFDLPDALTLRGLVFVCRGAVGAAMAGTVRLRCRFECDGNVLRSDVAAIHLTQTSGSGFFRIRCPIV